MSKHKRVLHMEISSMGEALARNYKNVHTDTTVLAGLGIIERLADGRVAVPWDEIETRFKLAA